MYCFKCGTKLPNVAKFCDMCGVNLHKMTSVSTSTSSKHVNKNYWEKLFNSRLNRGEYFFGQLLISIPFILIVIIGGEFNNEFGDLLIVISFIYFFIYHISAGIRRLHDLGYSSVYFLYTFIPVVNLYFGLLMLGKRGEAFENEYGQPPKSQFNINKIFALE